MQTSIVCAALLLLPAFSLAQISQRFDDPAVPWQGTDSAWQISNGRLQSSCMQPNSNFWIAAPAAIALPAEWEWWMQLDFNTSSNNYTDVFLVCGNSDLLQNSSGYFVRIGDKDDDVCLYKKNAANAVVKLTDGRNGLTDRRSSTLRIKVSCDDAFNWQLWVDTSGTGAHYVPEGLVRDSSFKDSVCFGILVRQSTASFFSKHFFDDVSVLPFVRDTAPPALQSVTALGEQELQLLFSEPPDAATALLPAHYKLGTTASLPVDIALSGNSVRLLFGQPFPPGDSLLLQVDGLSDAAGNKMRPASAWFLYYRPAPYEVLIHEILPDPDPPVSLPLPEFVELRNNSAYPVQFRQWKLSTRSGQATLPSLVLEPDSLLLLCRKDKAGMFPAGVRVAGLDDFPVLGNEADTLILYNTTGRIIHAVAYDKSWFAGSEKDKGGWSLEMAENGLLCSGREAWQPSTDPSGATPGKRNAVSVSPEDSQPFTLLRAELPDSLSALLYFSRAVDSVNAPDPAVYQFSPGNVTIAAVTVLPPLFNTVLLRLSAPLSATGSYTLQVKGLADCSGAPGADNSVVVALPAANGAGNILFSEVLFDARSPAPEFVEIYNHGNTAVNLQQLYLNAPERDTARVALSRTQRLLMPGQYLALTRDPDALCRYYTCKAQENLLQLSGLPALPNEGGQLALYSADGALLDVLHYSPDMQSPLAADAKGVSLERLHFDQPGADPANWHPAAFTAGYATPGSANSQQLTLGELPGELSVQPPVFSPDNDGVDDVAVLSFRLPRPGSVGNVTIYDALGRPVRRLLQSGQLANQATIIWDGLNDSKQRLPAGIYIIFTEVFDLQGRVKRWKLPLVVARNLN
ncbi:lamin tail domain-containing protein [uncultured Chitinophaga sp.]|jgi:hypothetical protein|uniref:lamin tail domain-containing protein n=1 Tax=uncultured Chitinophaga sp. TaxID=339340 RepID=UPI00261589D6|nr:lamin tail domain-containing protein [uncultured Chitinophaga sp.]